MVICPAEKCVGCCVCADVCPKQCITIQYDNHGFLKSYIDQTLCVNCGKCQAVCPANHPQNIHPVSGAFKISRKDDAVLSSTSGGVAALLSEMIIKRGGVVVGCGFDEKLELKHSVAENIDAIENFKGSKYVQSYMGGIYKAIKQRLDENKQVLFVGTPCQVSALISFLGKPYDNLCTADLICHGVASQKVLDKAIEDFEKREHKKVLGIRFRNKENGYINCSRNDLQLVHKNGISSLSHASGVVLWFASSLSLRESCYTCSFVGERRCADLSLAYCPEALHDESDKIYGASLVFANTIKGEKLLDSIAENAEITKLSLESAIAMCARLHNHSKPPVCRKAFFTDLDRINMGRLISTYTLKHILPSRLTLYFRAFLRKVKVWVKE